MPRRSQESGNVRGTEHKKIAGMEETPSQEVSPSKGQPQAKPGREKGKHGMR
jgi:hypothetical protein